jgi:hypothetical protein
MRSQTKTLIYSILLMLPFVAFGGTFAYVQVNHTLNHDTFVVQTEFTNGILSAYGIVIGFWAVIIGLSHNENQLLWKNIDVIKPVFFTSLGMFVFCIFVFGLEALDVLPSYYGLFFSVLGFYITCIFLGITLDRAILRNRDTK